MITEKAKIMAEIYREGSVEDFIDSLQSGNSERLLKELIENCLPTSQEFIDLVASDYYKPEEFYKLYWHEDENGNVILLDVWKKYYQIKQVNDEKHSIN